MTLSKVGRCSWVALALAVVACDKSEPQKLAPTASALAPSKPASLEAATFAIDKGSSKVEFEMDAAQEKIRGRAAGSTTGELHVDVHDLTKTTGLITVDISGLEIFQRVVEADGKPGEEKKNDTQNQHARTWLEISDDAPEEQRKKNSRVEFSIKSIEKASQADVTTLTGAERKVTLTATGDFLLHGRKTTKTTELEATFHFDGAKPTSVSVKTVKPFNVGLAEHEVQPREAFGKLAAKTLDVLSPKVAKEALVSVEFSAKPEAGAEKAKPAE